MCLIHAHEHTEEIDKKNIASPKNIIGLISHFYFEEKTILNKLIKISILIFMIKDPLSTILMEIS